MTTTGASQKCDTSMGSIWAMEDFAVNSFIFHIPPVFSAVVLFIGRRCSGMMNLC